jgi:hypothetical protein
MTDNKLYNSIYKTVESSMTHNQLFNAEDGSIVEDMTLDLLKQEIKENAGTPIEECVIPFNFNGKHYDADYWQESTAKGDTIWCCEVTEFDIEMNMRDYNTEFMWSDYADNIAL